MSIESYLLLALIPLLLLLVRAIVLFRIRLGRKREIEEQKPRDEDEQHRREKERAHAELEARGRFEEKRRRPELAWPEEAPAAGGPLFPPPSLEEPEALAEEAERPIRFHALWQRLIEPQTWQTLLVYIFSGPRGLHGARVDFSRRMTVPSEFYDDSSVMARERVKRGTEISIYPELPGFRFNPPFTRVLWL